MGHVSELVRGTGSGARPGLITRDPEQMNYFIIGKQRGTVEVQ